MQIKKCSGTGDAVKAALKKMADPEGGFKGYQDPNPPDMGPDMGAPETGPSKDVQRASEQDFWFPKTLLVNQGTGLTGDNFGNVGCDVEYSYQFDGDGYGVAIERVIAYPDNGDFNSPGVDITHGLTPQGRDWMDSHFADKLNEGLPQQRNDEWMGPP